MSVEIRPLLADEMLELGRMGAYVYGGAFGHDADNMIARGHKPEWTLCALENGELLSSFVDLPFTMRANGRALPMCGVSVIGTFPEYRRRGLVRTLHTRAFEKLHEEGRGVAGLWASQAAIYQRYGYAHATVRRRYRIDSVDIAFANGDTGLGSVRLFDAEQGYEHAKALYIQFIARRSGYLHRSKALWLNNALDAEAAGSPIHIAVSFDANDRPNGYLVYTLQANKVDHAARAQELAIRDFGWLDTDAYRSLWGWIARHDLVGRVTWDTAPLDDPAPLLLREPRLLHAADQEGEWLRIVDVQQALPGRGYDSSGELTFAIADDPIAPWNVGCFHLDASPDGATLTPSRQNPDLHLDSQALALLFCGRHRALDLAAWGLISGSDAAVLRADALFATRHRPHCPDHY